MLIYYYVHLAAVYLLHYSQVDRLLSQPPHNSLSSHLPPTPCNAPVGSPSPPSARYLSLPFPYGWVPQPPRKKSSLVVQAKRPINALTVLIAVIFYQQYILSWWWRDMLKARTIVCRFSGLFETKIRRLADFWICETVKMVYVGLICCIITSPSCLLVVCPSGIPVGCLYCTTTW
jgi:hypothetical protein